MTLQTPQTITLPHSQVQIHFTEDYSPDKVADLTRKLALDEKLALEMRQNPTAELAKLGILIRDEDRFKVTDEDVLYAMGHRVITPTGAPGEVAAAVPLVLVAVVVVVGVINVPEPAY